MGGGVKLSFNPTKRGVGKGFSHPEVWGTKCIGVVLTRVL